MKMRALHYNNETLIYLTVMKIISVQKTVQIGLIFFTQNLISNCFNSIFGVNYDPDVYKIHQQIYTAVQRFGFVRDLMFLKKSLLLTKAAFIESEMQYNCEILLQSKIQVFYCNIFLNAIYSCDAQLNFQHHYSSLQGHMIFQR